MASVDVSDDDRAAWDPNLVAAAGPKDELVLLSVESMRARRRPAAIALLWAWQAAVAAMVAWPAASGVAGIYGGHPSGDAPLWAPGGLALVDLLNQRAALSETFTLAGVTMLVAGFADLVPLAGLVASVAYVTRDMRPPSVRAAMGRGAAALPTFASLYAMACLAEGFVVGFAALVVVGLSEALAPKLGAKVGEVIEGFADEKEPK